MKLYPVTGLAMLGSVFLIEPAFAGACLPAPGPIAGIGLPALALIGGAYWLGRKFFGRR